MHELHGKSARTAIDKRVLGLRWGIERTNAGEALWHWGDYGAFKCFAAAYPKKKIGVVLFTNSENGLAIANDVVQAAIGAAQPALTWIKYDRYDSPAMQFRKALHEKGVTAAMAEFRYSLERGDIPERSINSMGYNMLGQKRMAEAIQLFQLNVKLYPKSANVYDSLGEAYMDNSEKELAIQNYAKSLELDNKNNNALEILKKLRDQ